MKQAIKKGLSFGLVSGIITTLGIIVGLNSSTSSKKIIISGVLVIAIADALSDAMGIHISEEAENVHTEKEIWISTLCTFIAKFIIALSFLVPVILLEGSKIIFVSVIWGLSLIVIFSIYLSIRQNIKPHRVITEHLSIAIFVIFATNYVGELVSRFIK